jgi:hypothetical protein
MNLSVPFIVVAIFLTGFASGYFSAEESCQGQCSPAVKYTHHNTGPKISMIPVNLDGVALERDKVIDTGMENTTVLSVLHLYDDYPALNADYRKRMAERGEETNGDVWGWSDCEWVPDHNYAGCDIYTVRPTYVHAEMVFDTLGHEVWHGVAGSFHGE